MQLEKNAEAVNIRKTLRYNALKSDLENRGYRCLLVPFEVGSRGHVRKASNVQLSLHENVVFSVCALMCNATYVISIMCNSISGLNT